MKIAVIGGGLMGRAIALEFAMAGHTVSVRDISDERLAAARVGIEVLGSQIVDRGIADPSTVLAAQQRLSYTTSVPASVAEAEYVVEAAPEILELKQVLFKELDACAPISAIFASNTSGFRPDQLAMTLSPARRLVIAHYFNPAHLVPLVEVAAGQGADDGTVAFVVNLLRSVGKVPVRIKRPLNGLVANRLQTALFREALHLLSLGAIEADDLDHVMTAGLGPRWAALGPLTVADFAGLRTWQTVFRTIAPDLDNSTDVPAAIADRVDRGDTGVDVGRGFYEWSQDQAVEAIARRNRMLIQAAGINGYQKLP